MSKNTTHSKKHTANQLDSWAEWQEHQYTPGYYIGRRQMPWLTGKRPNRFGYTLVSIGCIVIGMVLFGLIIEWDTKEPWGTERALGIIFPLVGLLLFGILPLLTGIRLLRK